MNERKHSGRFAPFAPVPLTAVYNVGAGQILSLLRSAVLMVFENLLPHVRVDEIHTKKSLFSLLFFLNICFNFSGT